MSPAGEPLQQSPRQANGKCAVPSGATLRRLVVLWSAGLVVIGALLLGQTVTNVYGDQTSSAWAWLFPQVLPTLSLTVAVLFAEERSGQGQVTSRFISRAALLSSGAYLGLLVMTLLLRPLSGKAPMDWLLLSTSWLAPLQMAVQGVLGIFLGKRDAPQVE